MGCDYNVTRREKFPGSVVDGHDLFLTTGLPSPHLRTNEKKILAIWSRNFYLVEGMLYHKGSVEYGKMRRMQYYARPIVVR